MGTLVAECTGTAPGSCPASAADVPWREWAILHIAWPLAVQAVLIPTFWAVLQPWYRWAQRRTGSCFRWFIKSFVGTSDKQAKNGFLIISLFTADMVACAVSVLTWLVHTFWRETTAVSRGTLLGAAFVHLLASVAHHLRNECAVSSAWTVRSCVDAFTIVPTLTLLWRQEGSKAAGVGWLSLHWLRAASVIEDFLQIQGLSYRAKHTGVVAQMVVLLIMRVACLIVTMAGTIFTSEVLGDLPLFDYFDNYVTTAAGDQISPVQMCYWIVVSITTVGYGDWTPKTLLGRALTSLFVVAGFLYAFLVQIEFTSAWAEMVEGSGVYQPHRKKGSTHVVVVLCTQRRAIHFSTMLAGFLREILNAEHAAEWPDVVIFSRTPWDSEVNGDWEEGAHGSTFEDFLRDEGLSANVRRRVQFIVGKLSSKADMDRAAIGAAYLTYLLADVASAAPDREDEDNLFTAILLRQFFPRIRLRVMLLRPQTKELAVQAGIEISRCFSLQELKANILAQNVRCHGLVPVITGMLHSVDLREEMRCFASQDFRQLFSGESAEPDEHFVGHQSSERSRTPGHESTSASPPCTTPDGPSSPDSSASLSGSWGYRRSCSSSMRSETETSNGSLAASLEDERQRTPTPSKTTGMPGSHGDNLFTSARSGASRGQTSTASVAFKAFASVGGSVMQGSAASWKDKVSPWVLDYMEGMQRSVFGFELAMEFEGMQFGEVVAAVFERTGAIVIAAYVDRNLAVCPQGLGPSAHGQIFFAVAKEESTLAPVRSRGRSPGAWRMKLLKARHAQLRKARREGPHVSAAMLLGQSLHRQLIASKGHSEPDFDASRARKLYRKERTASFGMLSGSPLSAHSPTGMPFAPSLPYTQFTPSSAVGGSSSLFPQQPGHPRESQIDSLMGGSSSFAANNYEAVNLREQQRRLRELRSSLNDSKELVVLIVCQGEVWQQVRTFVNSLRAPYLPDNKPIVIFAPTRPPKGLLDEDTGEVLVVEGNCTKTKSLIQAGVLEAGAVVVMSGQVTATEGQETLIQDSRLVLCAQVLECWCGMSDREVFATYELQHSGSVRRLPKLMYKPQMSLEKLLDGVQPIEAEKAKKDREMAADVARRVSLSMSITSGMTGSASTSQSGDGDPLAEGQVRHDNDDLLRRSNRQSSESSSAMYHPRFAAGQIFTPELWGAMLGCMFYMPAIIELVEAMVMPHRRGQQAYPWQIRVPATYVGEEFSLLLSDLATGKFDLSKHADDLQGLSRASSGSDEGNLAGRDLGPAIALALCRRREETISLAPGTGGHNYTILAPPGGTRLRWDDWVVVIGSERFGRYACETGLLRGNDPSEQQSTGDDRMQQSTGEAEDFTAI